MIKSPFEAFNNVTVAVGFDDHTNALVKTAVEICQATRKNLCLVHSVEPWAQRPAPRALGAPDPLWNATLDVTQDGRSQAQTRLEQLAASVPKDVKVTLEVLAGKPGETLPPEILRLDTALLLVGARFNQTRLLPDGLSTAIALMQHSPVPVMVYDTTSRQMPTRHPRILVADDLSDASEPAVRCAVDLGIALKATAFWHLHISAIDKIALEAALSAVASASHAAQNLAAATEDIYSAVAFHYGVELEKRSEPYLNELLAAGADYRPKVTSGNTRTELSRMVDECQPDLLVFGRHASFHRDPFFFGRLPYRAMLAFRRPVLVVPGENVTG